MAIIDGTPNGDRLTGTDENDEISGLAGNDLIRGGRGNDLITGGLGNDIIFGEDGEDELRGEDGDDGIVGGAGVDRLVGGDGIDRMAGSSGDDKLFGQNDGDILRGDSGNDRIDGGAGDDVILGHGGLDTILGRDGNDRVAAGSGNDRIFGGNGNDRLMGQAGADILSGGAGADEFVYGSLSHAGDVITDFNPDEGDTLPLIGSLDGAEVRTADDGVDTTVSVRPTGAQNFTDLVVLDNFVGQLGPAGPIDVWYGDTQTFGDPGVPQQWVNILGSVETDGLNSLTWSLNGGAAQNLAFATTSGNFSRLADQGDFNVELDYGQLDPTAADDVVTIQATYNGDVVEREVTIDYEAGQQWPTDYSIDWSQENDIQDAVQVVDGNWSFDDNGARPVEIGFDRILALGDETWDGSYEVRVPVTMHDLTNPDVGGEGVLFGMQWGGHTDPEFDGLHTNFIPLAHFRVGSNIIQLRPSEFFDASNPDNPSPVGRGFQFNDGETYEFLIQNERIAGTDDRAYGIKAWVAGTDEPDDFWIRHTMTEQEPDGSFLLIAHFVDVTFGDVTVNELPDLQSPPPDQPAPLALQVADVVQGEDSLEPLLAAGAEPSGAATTHSASAGGPNVSMSDLLVSGDEANMAA